MRLATFPPHRIVSLSVLVFLCGPLDVFAQPFSSSGAATTVGIDTTGPKGGIGWADFDGDGCLDLLVHTGASTSDYSHLYQSDCAASPTFTDVTSTLAPDLATTGASRSAVWADFSNDGYADFARNGPVEIWLNGGPTATPAFLFGDGTGAPSQIFSAWTNYTTFNTEGMAAIDYDGDGDLDLVVENADQGFVMLSNDGTGVFTELTPAATGLPASGNGNGDYITVGDFDVDGDVDILGRKDVGIDLWVNAGGSFSAGTFDETSDNADKGGVNFCDFDNDGDFDIFWTHHPTSQIWLQDPIGTFTATGEPESSAGVVLPTDIDDASCGDVDNDGDVDVYVAGTGYTALFVNQDPSTLTFSEYTTGLSQSGNSEGTNLIDFDNDGDLDIYASESGSDNDLHRNDGTYPDYLVVVPRVTLSNGGSRAAVGATVTLFGAAGDVVGGVRQIEGGSGHGTAGDGGLRAHFGLANGSSATYGLRTTFVGGKVVVRCIVPANLSGYRLVEIFDTDSDDLSECAVSVTISSPASGTTTNDPRPAVSGTATPGATVTIVINAGTADESTTTVTADATTGDWSYTPTSDLPEGDNSIDAAVSGAFGQSASDSIVVTVDTVPPALTISQPSDAEITGRRPTLSGTTEPGATVTIDLDGMMTTVTADSNGDWSHTPSSDLADGMYTVTVTATDGAGNSSSESVTFEVNTDECALGTDNCDPNATCTNTMASFTCTCNAGFTGDGVTCTDVDECSDGTAGCDANATCTNEPGSFSCDCNAGWVGDGFMCADVDECAMGTDNCDANALCLNDLGSFTCRCNLGWEGDGVTCTDVDECADGTDTCDANATCTNTMGGFDCECNEGYFGNGMVCTLTPGCGNGALEDDEECDDGNDIDTDSCLSDCTEATCGDGIVWEGIEECDDANADDQDGCTSECLVTGCGDGVVQSDEECDDGWWANSDTERGACRTDCSLPTCGDGIVDPGESCDAGPDNGSTPNGCRDDCSLPLCGNGVVDPGEACDTGPDNSDSEADACRTTCVAAFCGDGVVDSGEACDDGIAGSQTCSAQCQTLVAGDFGSDGSNGSGGGVAVTPEEGCGCGTAEGDADASWLLLLVGFGLLRRRR